MSVAQLVRKIMFDSVETSSDVAGGLALPGAWSLIRGPLMPVLGQQVINDDVHTLMLIVSGDHRVLQEISGGVGRMDTLAARSLCGPWDRWRISCN